MGNTYGVGSTGAEHRRRPAGPVIFHSDRGSEYLGTRFCRPVVRLGLLQSASARGPSDNAHDNAHMESFFHSLKAELTRGVVFADERGLRTALQRYIRYYNGTRMHSSLNYRSPLAFERQAA